MIQAEVRSKGLKDAQRKFREFEGAIKQGRVEPIGKAADLAIKIIKERTLKGLDIDHSPFKPYSSKYAKKKGTSKPDLKVSGDMLGAIKRQAWAKKARIFISAGLQWVKGKTHNVGGRSGRGTGFAMPKREFMGVDREKSKIIQVMIDWWRKYKRQVGL